MRRLRRLVHAFDTSPRFQFAFQATGVALSLLFLIWVPLVVFLAPGFWAGASLLALVEITDWGNFVTDYQGVAAAEASGHSAALRHFALRRHVHHRILHWIADKLALDARFQYRMHLLLVYNWALQAVVAVVLFVLAPEFFDHWGVAYTTMQNGYTNLGTGLAALPDTRAAMNLEKLRQGRSPWQPDPPQADTRLG